MKAPHHVTTVLVLAVLSTAPHHGAANARPMHTGLDYQRYLAAADKIDAELDAWMHKFGSDAEKNGWLPPTESRSADEIHEDRKQRFFLAKELVTKLERENPAAQFSTNSPFSLMTSDEFSTYVKNSYLSDVGNGAHTRRLRVGGHSFGFGGALQSSQTTTTERQVAQEQPEEDPNDDPEPDAQPEEPSDPASAGDHDGVDWSSHQCMAPIQNQGQCGSCWAFASVSTVETTACLANNGNFQKFSEQYVTGCDHSAMGCNGGVTSYAMQFMQEGVCSADEVPYTAQDGNLEGCNSGCNKINTGMTGIESVQGEDGLLAALDRAPVNLALSAGNEAWKQYQGGVLSACDSIQVDHAVVAVGYDATSIKIRNSWGTSWGEDGYMRLQRTGGGPGMCGMYQYMYRAVF